MNILMLLDSRVGRLNGLGRKCLILVSHQILQLSLLGYQKDVKDAKAAYFSNIISQHSNSPKNVFKTINGFLNPNAVTIPPSTECCDKFLSVFSEKTKDIMSRVRVLTR